MSKTNFYQIILFCLFWFTAAFTFAQKKISVKASVDKNKILIGEKINLTLEASIPQKEIVHFFSIDSIPHFELESKGKVDTSKTDNGILLKQVIPLTSFDSGHWVIPSFILNKKIKTDPIGVDIGFSDFDPTKDYHDIKDIIEVNPAKEKDWTWYIVAGAAILVAVVSLVLRRKKKPVLLPAQTIDPYKEAMQQLQQIQKEPGSPKKYYSGLIDVFRLYIFRKKGFHSLQETTDDLVLQLKNLNLDKTSFEQLSQALRLSDFVKFAKYVPDEDDNKIVFETIKKAIQLVEESNS
ncbi:MAG: LPXTG cell wall anchor domain-containing protein [Chitinophagales bacterium]